MRGCSQWFAGLPLVVGSVEQQVWQHSSHGVPFRKRNIHIHIDIQNTSRENSSKDFLDLKKKFQCKFFYQKTIFGCRKMKLCQH